MADVDWPRVAADYLETPGALTPARTVIAKLIEAAPLDIGEALDPVVAERSKAETTAFLLFAIRAAVSDHALSPNEIRDLRHLQRVLRIEEGDLVAHHEHELALLLCQELSRLLEDSAVDPEEAVHKVALQELAGLGYDQFLRLTAPEIEKVIVGLVRAVERRESGRTTSDGQRALAKQIATLQTVYDLNAATSGGAALAGYLYLLKNPAMPGLIKIGRTNRRPEQRIIELAGATGVPMPFELLFEVFVDDARTAEEWVHSQLEARGLRLAANREFFSAEPSAAIELMLQARNAVASPIREPSNR